MIDDGAEVERILDGPPGRLAFRALCAALGRAGAPQSLVSFCDERLASWPDAVREAPWSWLAALDAGHSKPGWPLVRSLALSSAQCGLRDAALPDPRRHPEVRGVTHLDLGWFATDRLTALVETLDHWDGLRSVQVGHLTDGDAELVARLAASPAVARLESLSLLTVQEDMWHFGKPPFRPDAGAPWRLRHAGLRAPDLVHLMRSGLVPDLRSAEVLVCDAEEARDLAACPELARLDRLAIGFRCGKNGRQPLWKPYFGNVIAQDDDACEVFFARADLANLRGLTVRGTSMGLGREGLGARGVDAIAASGVLGQLTELALELLPVGDATIAGVLKGIDPGRIEKLTLADLVATDRTAEAFAAAGAFPRLRHLDLSRNRLGAAGARRVAADVRMPALEHLDLSGRAGGSPYYGRPDVQPVGDPGAEAWASSDNATGLTYLGMSATGLGADGLVALMTSERLRKLDTLDVSHNPVGSWPAPLKDAPVWRTLRTLNADECGLDDDDIAAMAAVPSAPRLRGVSLDYNSVGSRGARTLASWTVLPQLWRLNLHDHVIGDDGLIALAASGAARRLLELDLEQDCWNPRKRRYGVPLPDEVIDPASFPSLDAMFLGIVDEYHGARYSCGFPERIRTDLASASTTRPELAAFLTHLDAEELDDTDDPDQEAVGSDHDFRTERTAHHIEYLDEAREFAQRMIEGTIDWPPPAS
ncbi:hypothetical protein [Actinomadura bangladeshensis]|uniref:Leucine-rich repeat domain-containing protein n=1 Tax=Actinomadura bangladeshensis TaxID=453573 RepID=A0A4R4NIV0_9ACTN|nr:hypothetical protein [Actinomadura bangladeshensis]TDC08514.1 hypothetical protein E1284_30890 [Actinomadura bangladeshensis]